MTENVDRIGTEILFENDAVRVWDMRLAPGESTGLHSHASDYLFVYVTPENDMEVHLSGGDVLVESSKDGAVKYFVVGRNPNATATHELRNVGSTPHRQIIVELLEPSKAESSLPPVDNGRSQTTVRKAAT